MNFKFSAFLSLFFFFVALNLSTYHSSVVFIYHSYGDASCFIAFNMIPCRFYLDQSPLMTHHFLLNTSASLKWLRRKVDPHLKLHIQSLFLLYIISAGVVAQFTFLL